MDSSVICLEPVNVVVDHPCNGNMNTDKIIDNVPKDVEVKIEHGDSCEKNASYSSKSTRTSTDEEDRMIAPTSSFSNCSDCDTVSTGGSNSSNLNSNSHNGNAVVEADTTAFRSSATTTSTSSSVCSSNNGSVSAESSASASTWGSKKMRHQVDRMNTADSSEVDKLITQELGELTVNRRSLVQEEIHGVSTCALEEDETFITDGLERLEEEIRAIHREVMISPVQESRSGNSYDEAIWPYLAVEKESSSSAATVNLGTRLLYSYIFHRDFRLKFLRADMYEADKAAHRYLRCVEGLHKYFGSFALQRPLMYEDLGKECQDAAKSGYVQILPSRDRAGRLVVVSQAFLTEDVEKSMAIIIKFFIYIFSVVSEDIETQKRGVVFIFSTSEKALMVLQNPDDKVAYSMYREGCPVRRSCTHFCLPENKPKMRIVRAVMMLAMPRQERIRTRVHMDGLTMETQYKLMTFGIPVSELPITSTGGVKTKHHLQWIRTRKALDTARMKSLEGCYNTKMLRRQQEEKQRVGAGGAAPCNKFCAYPTYEDFMSFHGEEPIIHPMINDVLFSKGGKNVSHYGNIEFTDLMKRSLIDYVRGTPLHNRKMRKAIRQSIVDEVQNRGGRFLTLDRKLRGGYCWTEIQEGPDLHDRIATSLYDHKRRLAAKLKVQKGRCETAIFTQLDNAKRRKIMTCNQGRVGSHSTPDSSCCSRHF
uniref:DUF6824 domain-containing protein n=1 Tax=Pseudo-nitzschia australis TaxID=44445 RepID=A0A7S4EL90_9STRA|mmetsp:Transcript_26219/g.57418  ORF Transcript_26219/g.57418 Transcript_26219/m.57418 type:complete len:705 (-) Transcript_26219:424-2538(-)|eukprot:CAMPEP_0168186094 /NCGR_PEP_ID=MMETSP0139_2-20121125/14229_1 /TAXON_ID=44445 /ORGANISM="Pseudo-nitzschia australis, Strain 10249 10 AB" /LENGTH=704 /DNA_ID=CAMNT_0008108039 /DNA_START=170 /DNA_END=2284 /DNA_ORIENTATION=+